MGEGRVVRMFDIVSDCGSKVTQTIETLCLSEMNFLIIDSKNPDFYLIKFSSLNKIQRDQLKQFETHKNVFRNFNQAKNSRFLCRFYVYNNDCWSHTDNESFSPMFGSLYLQRFFFEKLSTAA